MLNENLKQLRKSKGLSQEELAIRLNVVRQTISKWEKGLSVPDADMLIKIADIFEVSVSELLGAKIDERKDAKKNKDYETADKIRSELDSQGIILNDTVNGTVWDIKALY